MTIDLYDWKARQSPTLIALMAPALAAACWFPNVDWKLATPFGVAGLLSALLAQVGRDRGYSRQDWLFSQWGGAPTTRMLRHRDTHFDPKTLVNLHRKLARATDVAAPTLRKEQNDPQAADLVYEGYARHLRGVTRDHKKYFLVWNELCNYGFRRNLWGWRAYGLPLSLLSLLAIIPKLHRVALQPHILAIAALVALLSFFWAFWVSPSWVKIPADSYAKNLLDAGLDLPEPHQL